MKFTYKNIKVPELKTKNINNKRFYITPEDNYYPSITSVLSRYKQEGLLKWKAKVGEKVANHIASQAARRGTLVHYMCEDYLNNVHIDSPEEWKRHEKEFFPWCLFNQLKDQAFDKINNIYLHECALYSDKYKVAGRVDCIAEYNGTLSIIDFKTSTRERKDEWNENYYIQASAYAEMFEERTGINLNQIVILTIAENGTFQEFIKDKHDYLNNLIDSIKEWDKENEFYKD